MNIQSNPRDWKNVILREICHRIDYGYTASAKQEPVGPKFLRITDIVPERIDWNSVPYCEIDEEKLKKYRVERGDIVVARTGATTGYAKWVDGSYESVFASYLVRLRVNPAHNSRYVGYIVQSEEYKRFIQANLSGAAQPQANAQVLSSYRFELPPRAEQDKIASILTVYDDLIENNTRRIAILEEMARLIYREWFVHFRFPGHEDVEMVESEVGVVPEGWGVERLKKHIKLTRGISYRSKDLGDEGEPMLSLKSIQVNGGFNEDGTKIYSGDFKKRHILQPGQIVIANTDLTQEGNVIGSPALVPSYFSSESDILHTHHLYSVRPKKEPTLGKYYLYHLLLSEDFKGYAKGMASGTTVLGLRSELIYSYEFVRPNPRFIERFEEVMNPIYDALELYRGQIRNLRETRDLLLPKLVSGEVEVKGK